MLQVQQYLQSGKTLNDLSAELGIVVKVHDSLPLCRIVWPKILFSSSPELNPASILYTVATWLRGMAPFCGHMAAGNGPLLWPHAREAFMTRYHLTIDDSLSETIEREAVKAGIPTLELIRLTLHERFVPALPIPSTSFRIVCLKPLVGIRWDINERALFALVNRDHLGRVIDMKGWMEIPPFLTKFCESNKEWGFGPDVTRIRTTGMFAASRVNSHECLLQHYEKGITVNDVTNESFILSSQHYIVDDNTLATFFELPSAH